MQNTNRIQIETSAFKRSGPGIVDHTAQVIRCAICRIQRAYHIPDADKQNLRNIKSQPAFKLLQIKACSETGPVFTSQIRQVPSSAKGMSVGSV